MSATVTQMAQPEKKKRSRSPSVAKPAYIVVQMLGEDGNPTAFDKKKLRIVAVERTAEKVLEMTEGGGEHQHAFYIRVIVPVARQAQPRTKAAA